MLDERPTNREGRREWMGLVLALAGAAVLGTLAGTPVRDTSLERTAPARVDRGASLSERLSAVDAAIAERDQGRAVRAWRDAYGVALGARGWQAMAAVGDAAVRVDALMSSDQTSSPGFRTKARQAYLVALFRAREAGAPEGIERIADAFAVIGDDEVAARARGIQLEAGR